VKPLTLGRSPGWMGRVDPGDVLPPAHPRCRGRANTAKRCFRRLLLGAASARRCPALRASSGRCLSPSACVLVLPADRTRLVEFPSQLDCLDCRNVATWADSAQRMAPTRQRALVRAERRAPYRRRNCAVRTYGIGTIVDLRSPWEFTARCIHSELIPATEYPVHRCRARSGGDPAAEHTAADLYRGSVDRWRCVANAIRVLPRQPPVRRSCIVWPAPIAPGMLVALLLDSLGRRTFGNVADYNRTDDDPTREPDTMQRTLDHIDNVGMGPAPISHRTGGDADRVEHAG